MVTYRKMLRNALLTVSSRRTAGILDKAWENSPFYGQSDSVRQELISHIKGWEGPRVQSSKLYKERIKNKDGVVVHPMIFGDCENLSARVEKYCEYNETFRHAEMTYEIAEEEKRKAQSRKALIRRGDLAQIRDFKRLRRNVFRFECSLPTNHNLTQGQAVNLIETDHDDDQVIALAKIAHGTISRLDYRNGKKVDITIDFSKSEEQVPIHLDLYSTYDIEITSNLASYERMLKAIAVITNADAEGPLPLWLIMFMESLYSKKNGFSRLSRNFETEVNDIYGIISAHKETQMAGLDLPSNFGEEYNCVVIDKDLARENLQKILADEGLSLNESQQKAVVESTSSLVSLIQGPPGCGKTHTAAFLVKVWLESLQGGEKKKVLVLAQSNKAVVSKTWCILFFGAFDLQIPALTYLPNSVLHHQQDQLCSSLMELSLNITRVGTAPKLQENVQGVHVESQLQELVKTIKAADDLPDKVRNNLVGRTVLRGSGYADTGYEKTGLLKEVINNADVICATCIGSRHDHLRHLDPNSVGLILMDEASQASELEALVPLTAFPCSQIIFIGDQNQLPPTILSNEAKKGGEHSLFSRLIEFGATGETDGSNGSETSRIPKLFSSTMLMEQYRMHPDISAFPNAQFYDSKLLDGISAEDRPLPQPSYLWPLLENGTRSCVAFVGVEQGKEDRTQSKSFCNQAEVDIVVSVVEDLLANGLKPEEIGIISPYMGQVVALKRALLRANIPIIPKRRKDGTTSIVEVNSIDAFQGSEKDVIIMSTVRANDQGSVGFLKDYRRMNVALTRAKRGLVVIGHPDTLRNDPSWKAWLEWYKDHTIHVEVVPAQVKKGKKLSKRRKAQKK